MAEKNRLGHDPLAWMAEAFLKQTLFPQKVKRLIMVSVKAKRADKLFSKFADRYTRQLNRL